MRPETLTLSADQYFVLALDGTSYERERADRTLAATVNDIIGGEFNEPGRVIRVNVADGSCSDVTEEVARVVLATMWVENNRASWTLRSWIESALGACEANCLIPENERAA